MSHGLRHARLVHFRLLDRQVAQYRWRPVTRAVEWLDEFAWTRFKTLRRYSFHVIVAFGARAK